ncbi:MAG: transposase [Herbinix sp.]|nr:transposase [Herbinix sp.]
MGDIQKRYPFDLHAYCLMTNHYHLLIETKEKEIWYIMRRLSQRYTGYYIDKYGMTGHLLQGRYRSCLIREDAYFLQTSRYIHLNPVKARMTAYPENYLWSNYQTFVLKYVKSV